MTGDRPTWRFPRVFWIANLSELFERAAYYGTFIVLTLYLTDEVGFTDVETGWLTAFFAAGLYLAPTFSGALADKLGFRLSLLLAFGLLAVGYASLGTWPTKVMAVVSLGVILAGGSFIKPVITGTVAKCSDELNRARAFSIFYQMVNIGSFTGKTFAKPLRTELGLEYINYYSAIMALLAFFLILATYHDPDAKGQGKSMADTLRQLGKVLKNIRFMALILIVAGFWAIQGQLYATMPKYVLRMVGADAAPEWLANINPLVVVILVIPITHLVRRLMPVSSIAIALGLIPFSALVISLSPVLQAVTGVEVGLPFGLGMHPITIMVCIGIALQGLSECFLSPKFLEYASRQAPPGEVGLYMGYSHLTTFFAWLFGFAISGYLLEAFCPDPATLEPGQMATAYQHAHYIWYVFAGVGAVAFLALLVFRAVTGAIDRRRASRSD